MGMDRNTVYGFLLIGAMLIGMFIFNSRSQLKYEGEKARIADSIKKLNASRIDTAAVRLDSLRADSLKMAGQTGGFQQAPAVPQTVTLENDVLKIDFSTRGAQPAQVTMKGYHSYDSSLVVLQKGSFNKMSYAVNSGVNKTAQTADLVFVPSAVTINADNSKSIQFTTGDSTGMQITHLYTLRPGSFMMDMNIIIHGANRLFSQPSLNMTWNTEAPQIEKDHKYETTQTHVVYKKNGKFDFSYLGSGDNKTFSDPVQWLGVKQQFFIAALIPKTPFSTATAEWKVPADTNAFISRMISQVNMPLSGAADVNLPIQVYYGPSDYNVLKKYGNDLEQIVPYGSGIFAFVKYINRYFLLPVFDFLRNHVASMGIVILLLTLLIRLITSPILYKSYLSGAKMKVLKPEVDALKAKFTDKSGQLDQQAFGMEQMKLWKSAGVSPLGGCLPALLQIPIFMSLYYFFQSNIDLRGKNFLWASDLATYDSIAHLPFSIPFYGDHVSLFTLTAVLTSLLISIYSMSNMQDNSNPVMKYMPYIFPVLLLGVFNKLPAALTWYYTVSNTITLILQIVIQKYIINHEKILVQINENRKKPVKKSKLQERMEAMQETQKKMQEMKTKSTRRS